MSASSSSSQAGQGSKSTSSNTTPQLPTTPSIPPLAAIFLTHFHDTKGQNVVYYISNNETKLRNGNIEHTTLPSGLHLISEDFFGFRHGTSLPSDYSAIGELGNDSTNAGKGKGDGTWPGVALFRSRESEGGRGRRMISLGLVLANPEAASQIFELKQFLTAVYNCIEKDEEMGKALKSLSKPTGVNHVPFTQLTTFLEILFEDHGLKGNEIPVLWRDGAGRDEQSKIEIERDLRGLARGGEVSDSHPIRFLPRLVDILGPLIVVVYKAAITGKRILIYSPPPLFPLSAFGWCIAALSLPPSGVDRHMSDWLGQVGLMDITALHARKEGWIASTSDKILLSHTKLYDLSIDLSSCNPLPTDPQSDSDSEPQVKGQAIIHTTSPSSELPIQVGYTFSDIPLYKLVSIPTTTPDWWITFYDLFDRVYSICAGVCEYAVGRGQVGISLPGDSHSRQGLGDGEDEDLLQNEDEVGNDGDRGEADEAKRGQTILRQFYHHSYHLGALLDNVTTPGEAMTMGQVRELTGKWRVTGDEYKFWSDLAGHWQTPQA